MEVLYEAILPGDLFGTSNAETYLINKLKFICRLFVEVLCEAILGDLFGTSNVESYLSNKLKFCLEKSLWKSYMKQFLRRFIWYI